MSNVPLRTSARMALLIGIVLPLAETVRRIHQILDLNEFFNWFDDYLLGAIFVYAAYRALKKKNDAVSYLLAAWGIGVGGLFLSFMGQFTYYQPSSGDPGIFSTTLVAIVKGVILLYMIIGLHKAIQANSAKMK